MRGKLGTLLICLGAVMVLAATALFSWNWRESNTAGELSDEVLPLLVEEIRERKDVPADPLSPQMTAVLIDGYEYVGFLSLPTLELELPVISQWDYPALKVAPCRYSGSLYQDNLIICAHNYASHFGKLKELQPGDIVLFTDMDEHVVTFQMVERETLNPMDAEGMEAGDWDLTLFTCTIGGQTRVTIRLERVEVFRNPETEEPAKSEK